MRKLAVVLFIAVLGLGGRIVYQSVRQGDEGTSAAPLKVRIGHSGWAGYFVWMIAREKGMFREAGLDVEVTRYGSLGEVRKDFAAGKLDGRAGPSLDIVVESLAGVDQRIVSVVDYSNGADNIVAREGISAVKDFKGKRVAYEPGLMEEYFLAWVLGQNGMSLSDIIPVSAAGAKDACALLAAGKADVAVTYEPHGSQLVRSGPYHIVYDSAKTPGLIVDATSFHADFVKRRPELVAAVLRVYFKALRFSKEHPRISLEIAAKVFGTRPKDLEEELKGIKMLDEAENDVALTYAAGLQSLYSSLRLSEEFVREHKTRNSEIDTDKIIEPRFIKELAKGNGS